MQKVQLKILIVALILIILLFIILVQIDVVAKHIL